MSWNTASLLDDCLKALPAALKGTDAHVVVVDNCSADDSVETARRHDVELICNQINVGYARAMNQALAEPRPDVLIALNPDTVPGPGSLASLVRAIVDGPADIGLVAPRLLNPDGTVQHSVNRFPSPGLYAIAWFVPRALQRGWLAQRFWLADRAPHDRSEDIDWAIGAVHAIRTSALGGREPYDERWFMYVEDLELCWRLARTGWRRRLDTSSQVVHVGNAAGAQAWGDDRFRRYMQASYEWYAQDRGVLACRVWALTNVAGTLWWSLIHTLVSLVLLRPREAASNLRPLRQLRVHLCALTRPARTAS